MDLLTSLVCVVILSNMKAVELVCRRVVYGEHSFAELVLWQLPRSVPASAHRFKYRLAYVAWGICVIRYDNETGKGDHRHYAGTESAYPFETVDKLIADFQRDIARWMHENRNT